jgi:hypothetical protein
MEGAMRSLADRRLRFATICAGLILALSPGVARADNTLHISFVDTRDRKGQEADSDIVRSHNIDATLHGDGHVTEATTSFLPSRRGKRSRGMIGDSASSQLGDASGRVTWKVKGPHELQRIELGPRFIVLAEVKVADDKTCAVSVRYLLKSGEVDLIGKDRRGGGLAHFSKPRLLSAECSIQ